MAPFAVLQTNKETKYCFVQGRQFLQRQYGTGMRISVADPENNLWAGGVPHNKISGEGVLPKVSPFFFIIFTEKISSVGVAA